MNEYKMHDDGTMVHEIDPFIAMRGCVVCGALETHSVMGPAVSFFAPIPSSCGEHIEQVRALVRGEKVEIQLAAPTSEKPQ